MNAKEHLEKAIALNPEYSHAYYNLGLLHKKKAKGTGFGKLSKKQFP